MNVLNKGHLCSMLLVLLALGSVLGACGTDSPTGQITQTVPGVVTAGTATAGLKTCTVCHTTETSDWMLSMHGNVTPAGNLYSQGNPTMGQVYTGGVLSNPVTTPAVCKNCHDPQGDSQQLVADSTGNVSRPVVGCEACHSGGALHVAQGGAGPIGLATTTAMVIGTTSTLQASAQFRTCTACHELLDPNDPVSSPTLTPAHSPASTLTPAGPAYVITDTHFATPGKWTGSYNGATGQNIQNATGYAMDYSSETVCSDCHNPHKNADINREWALSAHAAKYAGFPGDPSTEDPLGYFSPAWAHYNWTDGSGRWPCQRCHTTTGFAAYANALRAGDKQRALDIQHGFVNLLSGVSPTTSFKPEMLKCNGCHSDNRGTLRNPGAITANYDYPNPPVAGFPPYSLASFAYPDVKGSNVCMACHTARESGETIWGLNDPAHVNITLQTSGTYSFFDFSTLGFINSHYLSAGGTVFTATGFEFADRSYDNPTAYRHVNIGSPVEPNTGSNGPCIGCHMSRPGNNGNHLFMPVTRSSDPATAGHIDGIASQICIRCHTSSGSGGLEDLVNERKVEYHEAVEATTYILDKLGFYFRPDNPYFYQLRTSSTATITVNVTNGSTTVTGVGTLWSSGTPSVAYSTGTGKSSTPDYFKVDSDGTYYRIASVGGDTSLTLEQPYSGPTANNVDFSIIKSGSAGSIKGWLTKAGKGIVPATVTDTDKTGFTTGRYNMGAAFNLNLVEHEPGGYVHNRVYVKRLMYDAIDWADDNQLNFSVGTTLSNLKINGADPAWKAGAMKYLLPNGVLGIAAERP